MSVGVTLRASWGPDRWAREYFAQRRDLGVPAINPVAAEWRVYDAVCHKCGGRNRNLRTKNVTVPTWFCADGACGAAWGFVDKWEPKGMFDRPLRPGTSEDRLYPWCDVGRALSALYEHPKHRWAVRVYLARVISGDSLRLIAAECGRRYARSGVLWNKDRVAQLVDEGRELVARRLVVMGLLERVAPATREIFSGPLARVQTKPQLGGHVREVSLRA